MTLINSIIQIITSITIEIFKIIIAPFQSFDVLWTLIPVYITLTITLYYHDEEDKDFPTMITNGFTAMWVSINWLKEVFSTPNIPLLSLIISTILLFYGLTIVIMGFKQDNRVYYLAERKELIYLLITLTPLFYNTVETNLITFVSIIVFFPIYLLTLKILWKLINQKPTNPSFNTFL